MIVPTQLNFNEFPLEKSNDWRIERSGDFIEQQVAYVVLSIDSLNG